jgi:hypothetical protein
MTSTTTTQFTGAPYSRGDHRVGRRWGTTKGKIGFRGCRRNPRLP